MSKLKLISALLISLSIGIIYAKDIQNINDQAEEVIHLYAEIIDSKNFSELKSIMQTNFKMTGMYKINSLEEFMFAMQELDKNFNVIFEDMTDMGRNYIMAQKFLEEVAEGDKRIIIINGNVIEHSIIRKSSENDHRSNIASGGYIEKYTLNSNEKKICGEIGSGCHGSKHLDRKNQHGRIDRRI